MEIDKHFVSEQALKNLKEVMFNQDDFGVKKYGVPVHHSYNYDWLKMLHEELADGLKYLECEMQRKSYVIQLLKSSLNVDNPKEYIEVALELLCIEGTGK